MTESFYNEGCRVTKRGKDLAFSQAGWCDRQLLMPYSMELEDEATLYIHGNHTLLKQ